MSANETENVSDLLQKIIDSVCGEQKPEVIQRCMRFSLSLLSSTQGIDTFKDDETMVANQIKSKLSPQDAALFDELHNNLKDGELRNRLGTLNFLLHMSQSSDRVNDNMTFPEMRLDLNIPIASTSAGYSAQISSTQAQVVPFQPTDSTMLDHSLNPSRIFDEDCISQDILVQDLIYSFQGIEGKILKLDSNRGFQIDSIARIHRSQKQAVQRLSELGYLYNIIQNGLDKHGNGGRVADSFVAALHKELSDYYRFVANAQEEVNRVKDSLSLDRVTLSNLHLWVYDPLETLKLLASIVRTCGGLNGGALASAVYEFNQNGDPRVKKLVKRILESVSEPLYNMLLRWITDGELDDPYKEFFIESCAEVAGERMWHEKYQVRDSMVPSFLSRTQAKKILCTGKSINFLREVCKDFSPLQDRETGMFQNSSEKIGVEAFFDMDPDGPLQRMMDAAYKETSTRVVDILTKQYHLMDHLQGIKGYLLLGQGHFVQHLMHLLEPELAKPANSLYPHNISSILETAVRATSTKLDELDVQKRLDIQLMVPSENETGWDVFALDYNVDGPIGTILEPSRQIYQGVFFSLWRAKRMEKILSAIWKQQITSAKMFSKMPEILPIQKQIHSVTSSMVHLVHQMQYYFLFEVIECSWDIFAKNLKQASSLDDIIAAHTNFIQSVKRGTLLDDQSQELMLHLRSVYGPILELQSLEETFVARATAEYQARVDSEKFIEKTSEIQKQWGCTKSQVAENVERKNTFLKYLSTLSIKLKLLSRTYQDRVKKFLLMLASAEDVSLQLLSVRLDFNEYYISKDSRLVAPLTYQRRRQSDQAFLTDK
ncbi:gamma-tubulin complex component 3 [Copidosoma floridanum]|uniref:gamma-tubulin complex component 3 n=1 Tax=Copidosoma floridanum TaxID=29053 RepID=UPI0006C99DAA|nr:gamma-tubulin complex component 3 [Copidosoma floridanum]